MNRVVRVGNTVRRVAGPWTATTQRLLAHVRARGFELVPEPFGIDEQGREVLSFLAGQVPHEMPSWVWSDAALADVAQALRRWHDATADFDADDATWQLPAREPREVVCHNDFAPYNCVFEDGRLVGVIDFDLCAPGARLSDLAYTAYRFVPLQPPRDANVDDGGQERSPFALSALRSRLETFLTAYSGGAHEPSYSADAVISAAVERLQGSAAWTEQHCAATGNRELEHHARMYRAHAHWLADLGWGGARWSSHAAQK